MKIEYARVPTLSQNENRHVTDLIRQAANLQAATRPILNFFMLFFHFIQIV